MAFRKFSPAQIYLLAVLLAAPWAYGQAGAPGTQSGAAISAPKGNCTQAGVCAQALTADELEAAVCQKQLGAKACDSEFCRFNPVLKCDQQKTLVLPPVPGSDTDGTGDDKAKADPKKPTDPSTDPGNNKGGGIGNDTGGGTQQSSAQCQQAAQQAAATCSSQGGGSYGSTSGGLNSFANTLNGATGDAARANIQQGVACTNSINSCINACQSSDPGLASQCSSLSSRVQQMGQQAQSLDGNQQQAANSGNQSSANGNGYSKGTENCAFNPNTEECRALAESKRYGEGKSGFDGGEERRDQNFNLGSSTDGIRTQFNGSGIGIDQIQAGARNGTIANNSGGGIPGSGGDGGGARLDDNRRGSPGSPGYTTDVLQGFQGGSGSSGAGGGNMNVDSSGGFRGYGQQAQRGPASQGLDLKRYLPGGSKQPNTRKLGGFIPFSVEINGPHVNIWSRISDRLMEKCRLGELLDCR